MLEQSTVTRPRGTAHLLETLGPIESDSLLALIALANADQRPEKIDVGVGVYRDGVGNTPIPQALKEAEKRLWETQQTKSYLGGAGDKRFAELIAPFLFGADAGDPAIAGVQTPGGCGALVLGFKLIKSANPEARVLVGTPTWPNHIPIIEGVGLEIVRYGYYDREARQIRFDQMMDMLDGARQGDVVLLHGCCHNPTGADLDEDQWRDVARTVAHRGLLPVVDLAYQGLGRGFEEDAFGLRQLSEACDELVVAHSCDKNFGVYRDRVGSLFVKSAKAATTKLAMAHVLQLAREMWSMPPDHGAAAVRIVLEDDALKSRWLGEVAAMRERINRLRTELASADPRLAFIGDQFGMFSMLPLDREQIVRLREDHAIYMADSGRFNIVGMADEAVGRFASAVLEVMGG